MELELGPPAAGRVRHRPHGQRLGGTVRCTEALDSLLGIIGVRPYDGAVSPAKHRVVAGALALILAIGLGACSSNDDEPPTTEPGGPTTTEPVGS